LKCTPDGTRLIVRLADGGAEMETFPFLFRQGFARRKLPRSGYKHRMRLLATADLHYNQPKSRALADALIETMNAIEADVLLIVGDTASSEGDALERCLSRFRFPGTKLFVAGNHELWTNGTDSYSIFAEELPRRVREMGWHWLENAPFVSGNVAIVGSIGWYDYSFAWPALGIPRRFYAAKISPGAAERFSEFAALFERTADLPSEARQISARWNDGKFVKLGRSDEAFLDELLASMETQLQAVSHVPRVAVATHCVPLAGLLPPTGRSQWDFARAFLGSERMGELIQRFSNVRQILCGHSHFPVDLMVGPIRAINIGSGYREKTYRLIGEENRDSRPIGNCSHPRHHHRRQEKKKGHSPIDPLAAGG
jgi:Icc-related predicted phosphoesterase